MSELLEVQRKFLKLHDPLMHHCIMLWHGFSALSDNHTGFIKPHGCWGLGKSAVYTALICTPTCVQFTLIYSMYTVYYCMDCMRRTCHCQGNTTLARSFYSFLPFAAARVSVRRFSKASPSKAYLTSKWLQNIHGLSFPSDPSVREAKMKQKH